MKFLHRGSVVKFLHHGSVERVLHRGSIEDCSYPLLGIEYHNDSYTMEVRKGSYIVEEWMIVMICCWVSSTVTIPTPWKYGKVNTVWKCGKVEKFQPHESEEMVLYCGSMDDCADPLLGIKHHNDSCTVEVWKGSYTVKA